MLLSVVSEQMHLALTAARNRQLVSSLAVLVGGLVELGCSILCIPFLARAESSFTVSVNGCGVLDCSTLDPDVPSCQQRRQELNSPAFGPPAHRLAVFVSSPCCF